MFKNFRMQDEKWFVVYTKTGQEKKVADLLTSKDIPNYCPINKITQRRNERLDVSFRPLFPSYIFVCLNDKDQLPLRSFRGIINFVYWLGEPVIIPAAEIEGIKNFLGEYSGIKPEKTVINRADHLRIIYGPLVVRDGDQFEVRNSPVSVILPSLGYVLVARERNRTAVNIIYQNSPVSNQRKFSRISFFKSSF